jgi:hypothetical protein
VKRLFDILFLLAFAVLGIILALRHEPWADEAQSWLLARDSSLWELLVERVRYEGSPALWQILLWFLIKLGLPYGYFNCIPVIAASIGVFLLLWRSKFPWYIKYLLPCTFFIFYQFGIVARSYSLMFPIFAGLAIIFPDREHKPYMYATLLTLLASTNVFGLIITLCLSFWYLLDIILKYKSKKYILPSILFTVSIILIVLTILLPDDYNFADGYKLHNDGISFIIRKISYILLAASTTVDYPKGLVIPKIWEIALFFPSALALILYGDRQRTLKIFLLPIIMIVLFEALKYSAPWHYGIVFLLVIFAFWITEENMEGKSKTVLNLCLLPVLLIQTYWAAGAFVYDYNDNYTGAKAAAEDIRVIKTEHPDYKIFCTNAWDIALLPYFDRNIYVNYNRGKDFSFYQWSNTVDRENTPSDLLKYDPDIVVFSSLIIRSDDYEEFCDILDENYDLIKKNYGAHFWKTMHRTRRAEENYFIFVKKSNKK